MHTGSDLYCEAKFWRPTGLGNRLFCWGRAKVFSLQTGCKMLSPEWAHLRAASILRGGIEYRHALRKILLFDNFIPARDEIKGLAKFFIRKQCVVSTVTTLQEGFSKLNDQHNRQLVSFSGHTAHFFDDLQIHREIIFSSLLNITPKKWHSPATRYQRPFIGINIRMGNDFKKATEINEFLSNKTDYLKTPLEWYIKSLRKVREIAGHNFTAVVISDGTHADLRMLLKEPDVIFARSESAISDLLILTKSAILIGAGRSSFSAWASFLGKIPTITIPGSDLQGFHISNDLSEHYVGEFDPDGPSRMFCETLRTQIKA